MTTTERSKHRETGNGKLWIEAHGKFGVRYEIETEQKTSKHPVAGVAATLPNMTAL